MLEDFRANSGLLTLAMIFALRTKLSLLYRPLAVTWGCSVPFGAKLGRRIVWQHGFSGIFISRDAVIGDDCVILHQVTIGSNIGSRGSRKAPVIGNRVLIGAGAKIIGGVHVGDDARIGANAVVVRDVPSGATVTAPELVVRLP